MSAADRTDHASTPRRTLWAPALALAVGVGATLGVQALLDRPEPPQGQARPMEEMGDVQGMEEPEDMDMAMDMSGDGSVRLTPDQIRTFGVTFDSVVPRTLEEQVRAVGVVAYDETRMARVTTKLDGYVERLHVDFTGRPVRRGEPMVEIYSPELVAAQEELLLARELEEEMVGVDVTGLPAPPSDLAEAARRRLLLWDIPEEQIEGILEEGRARRTLTLDAPVSGVVVGKEVLSGQAIRAGDPLFTVADLSRVWIEAELRESEAGLVEAGDSAEVELRALPGRPLRGTVDYVYPTLEPEARSLTARIPVPNPGGNLKPGMYATVRIQGRRWTALAVPATAVLDTGEESVAFVATPEGRLAPRAVEVGRAADGYVEVLTGLEEGDRVVSSALYLLDSESNLARTMRSMMGMMNMSDMGSMEGMDMDGMDGGSMDMGGMEGDSMDMDGDSMEMDGRREDR